MKKMAVFQVENNWYVVTHTDKNFINYLSGTIEPFEVDPKGEHVSRYESFLIDVALHSKRDIPVQIKKALQSLTKEVLNDKNPV